MPKLGDTANPVAHPLKLKMEDLAKRVGLNHLDWLCAVALLAAEAPATRLSDQAQGTF